MDSKFLEFWGNYLLAAAKGQQQLEDLNKWIQQGFSGFEALTGMFKNFYGLEQPRRQDADSAIDWQSVTADFSKSYNAYLDLMGMVPQGKYRELEQKYTALQKRVADREDTIKVLRNLLAEKGTYQGETTKVFQDLVNKQVDAFDTFMKSMATAVKEEE